MAVPAYPPGNRRTLPRLRAIFDDCRPAACIALNEARERCIGEFGASAAALAWIDPATALPDDGNPPEPCAVSPSTPAVLQYTSGSTSAPKGVIVSHRNVSRLFEAATQAGHFAFDEHDVWSLFHSHAFDFAVWELWGAWLYGGRAVLVPEAVCRQPDAFLDLLANQRISVLNQTPSAFYALQSQAARREVELSVRAIVFGGEALEPSRLQPWHARYPQTELINMYGITETTVHVSFHRLSEQDLHSPVSRIGRALPDLSVHVLDEAGQPVPLGVVGELVVEGDGVAELVQPVGAQVEHVQRLVAQVLTL